MIDPIGYGRVSVHRTRHNQEQQLLAAGAYPPLMFDDVADRAQPALTQAIARLAHERQHRQLIV
jgi:hypothetical protein